MPVRGLLAGVVVAAALAAAFLVARGSGDERPVQEAASTPASAVVASPAGAAGEAPAAASAESVAAATPPVTPASEPARTAQEAAASAVASTGTLRVVPAPPAGSRLTVRGGGEERRLTGGGATLPPGTYELELQAAGYNTARGTVRIRAGETTRWAPALAATPAPTPARAAAPAVSAPAPSVAPPAAREVAVDAEAAAAAQIQAVIHAFARSLESRNIAQVERTFPGASGAWLRQWRDFLEDVRSVRSLEARPVAIATPEIDGGTARVRFTVQLHYTDIRNAAQRADVNLLATLRREGDRWVLAALGQ